MEYVDGRLFNKKNYQKDIFLPLGGIEKKLATMKDEEWEVLDRKALATI